MRKELMATMRKALVQNMATMCTGMTHCTATVMRSGIHVMATMTVSTVETDHWQALPQTGIPAAAMAVNSASTGGDPVLECLQSLSDRLTDLEESRSVLAAPVQLAHGSTSDSVLTTSRLTSWVSFWMASFPSRLTRLVTLTPSPTV